MPPSGMAKKSITPAAQSASRQSRNVCKQFDKEVSNETQTDCVDVNDGAEEDEVDSSQGTAVQNMIIGGLSNQKKRHAVNKKKAKEDYDRTKVNLRNKITAFFAEHEDQSDAVHNAQLNYLANLLAMKATIESQLATKLTHLHASYDAHSKELSAVVNSRIKELK